MSWPVELTVLWCGFPVQFGKTGAKHVSSALPRAGAGIAMDAGSKVVVRGKLFMKEGATIAAEEGSKIVTEGSGAIVVSHHKCGEESADTLECCEGGGGRGGSHCRRVLREGHGGVHQR